MSITPVGGWKTPFQDSGDAYSPAVSERCCPNCKSDDWQSASLVYNQGLSSTNSRTKGTTVGIGRVGLRDGRFAVGGAVSQSRTFGVQQTMLSKMATPPRMRIGLLLFLAIVCAFFVIGAMAGISQGQITQTIVDGSIVGFLVFAIVAIYGRRRGAYEAQIDQYRDTRMCQRCGTFYVGQPSYRAELVAGSGSSYRRAIFAGLVALFLIGGLALVFSGRSEPNTESDKTVQSDLPAPQPSAESAAAQSSADSLQPNQESFDELRQIREIWQSSFGAKEEAEAIQHAPQGQEQVYRLAATLKEQAVSALNDDARARGISATWFLCGGSGALCANVSAVQANAYSAIVFSPQFEVSGVAADPLATGLWRQGFWAVVIRAEGSSDETGWNAQSPSPSGWVSLKEGVAAGEKRMRQADVDKTDSVTDVRESQSTQLQSGPLLDNNGSGGQQQPAPIERQPPHSEQQAAPLGTALLRPSEDTSDMRLSRLRLGRH